MTPILMMFNYLLVRRCKRRSYFIFKTYTVNALSDGVYFQSSPRDTTNIW